MQTTVKVCILIMDFIINQIEPVIFLFCDNGKKDVKARQPKINFKKFGASILILPSLAGNDASHHLYPIVPKSKV